MQGDNSRKIGLSKEGLASLIQRAREEQEKQAREKRRERVRAIERNLIHKGDFLKTRQDSSDGYIIMQPASGYVERNTINSQSSPSFIIRDVLYDPGNGNETEDRVIKYPSPLKLVDNPTLDEMIRHESRVLAALANNQPNNGNIVRAYKPIRRGPILYLPIEQLPFKVGQTIGEIPDMEGFYFFAQQSITALQTLKQHRAVHGDIKLSQFMAGFDDTDHSRKVIKLIDFSTAKHPKVQNTSCLMYSDKYAAPEINDAAIDGKINPRIFTHKSDIYSLGLLLARIALTEKRTPIEQLSEIFHHSKKPAHAAAGELRTRFASEYLVMMFEDMLQDDPEKRPDADELAGRIEEFRVRYQLGRKVFYTTDLYTREVRKTVEHPF